MIINTHTFRLLLLFTAIFFISKPAFCAEPALIGVLDEKQCSNEKSPRALIMFARTDNGWVALDSANSPDIKVSWNHQWTIGLHGEILGTLGLTNSSPAFHGDADWYYAGEVLLKPIGKTPEIENTHRLFSGWCDVPKFRTLVILSEPNTKDSAGWKPFKADSEYKQILFEPLKRILNHMGLVNCRNPDQEKAGPYTFRAKELKIFEGYRSLDNSVLISIGLDANNYLCDGPPGPEWSNHWFLIQNSNIEYIGGEMQFLDSGDFDGQTSAILFWTSGYNNDGYVLRYDNLKKKVEYKWHYH